MKSQKQTLTIAFGILVAFIVSCISHPGVGQTIFDKDDNQASTVIIKNGKKRTIVGSSTQVSMMKNGKTILKFDKGLSDFKIEYEGEMEISDDDTDIVGISRGGFIEISKSAFGNKRAIQIEANGSGQLTKKYYEGRKEIDWEPEGRKWLAEILIDIVRSSKIGAVSRVNRFYQKGGANAVFGEVEEIRSDYVKAAYLNILLDKDLSSGELVGVLKTAKYEVGSDYYLASLLSDHNQKFFGEDQTRTAFIDAASSISSDYYKTNVLKETIKGNELTEPQLDAVLESSEDIGSDYYLTSLLTDLLDRQSLNGTNLSKLLEVSDDISSDHYKSTVLISLMDSRNVQELQFEKLMLAMEDISSDHYTNQVLKEVLDNKLSDEDISYVLKIVEDQVSSDHYARAIITTVLKEQELNTKSLSALMDAVENVSSDYHLKEVMSEVSKIRDLTDEQLIVVLEACEEIGSDYYLSSTLVDFASSVNRAGDRVKSKYAEIAKRISSETYYGRAMKALDR